MSHRRRSSLPLFLLLLGTGLCPGAAERPHVLLLLADDLGYGDLACYGGDIPTPRLDALAGAGVRLTDFYANGPECTPTRVALLTGRYQQRVGGLDCAIGAGNVGRYDAAQWLAARHELGLPPGDSVLARTLQTAGYRTAVVGKWHLGYEPAFRPSRHGFGFAFGPLGYGGDYFYHVEQAPVGLADFTGAHTLARNGREVFRPGHYATRLIADEAIAWLDRVERTRPFFLYVPFTAPHSPYQGPDDDRGRPLTETEWTVKSPTAYRAMVCALDAAVGRLLDALAARDLERNTLVIFFSDNGGTALASNGILSGHKGQVLEGGIRVPCILRWPGHLAPGAVSARVGIGMDLTASILRAAGVDTTGLSLDGEDLVGELAAGRSPRPRTLFWRAQRGTRVRRAVRDGALKYLVEQSDGRVTREGLYDLGTDPAEQRNLLRQHAETVTRLRTALHHWERTVRAPRLAAWRGTTREPASDPNR